MLYWSEQPGAYPCSLCRKKTVPPDGKEARSPWRTGCGMAATVVPSWRYSLPPLTTSAVSAAAPSKRSWTLVFSPSHLLPSISLSSRFPAGERLLSSPSHCLQPAAHFGTLMASRMLLIFSFSPLSSVWSQLAFPRVLLFQWTGAVWKASPVKSGFSSSTGRSDQSWFYSCHLCVFISSLLDVWIYWFTFIHGKLVFPTQANGGQGNTASFIVLTRSFPVRLLQ